MKRLALITIVALAITVLGPTVPWATAEAGMPKVTVIHNGHAITVGMVAVVHPLHGDEACAPPRCF